MKQFGEWLDGIVVSRLMYSRLGAEEAKRRETLRALESEAKNAGLGVWAEAETVSLVGSLRAALTNQQRTVSFQLPADTQAFINEHKGREIDGELITLPS